MYLSRTVDEELIAWKNSDDRKPLLVRGARQVGKSTAIKHLARNFTYFIEVNFDEEPQLVLLFENMISLDSLLEELSIIKQTPVIPGETLIFFDEIQACIPALSSLRYFYEKKSTLHVIAAGSLLEFALTDLPSFGVGRVRSIFMYPFSFSEFLVALNEKPLLNLIQKSAQQNTPISDVLHEKLKNHLKKFFIVGGMPEAVNSYINKKDLIEVQRILNDIVISIQADFSKFNKRFPVDRVKMVFESVVQQVGSKFKYSHLSEEMKSAQVKHVLELLELAGLIHPVTHTSCNGIPLGAESNPKKRKYLVFDTGIYQRILGLNITSLLLEDDYQVINNGNIAELFVGLEIMKNSSIYEKETLYYWHREQKNSQAEVDYVIQVHDKIIPIEVKAGTTGKMKSLHLFLDEKQSKIGIRTSLENFGSYNQITTMPLYSLGQLTPYIQKTAASNRDN
jgi:uncharacterized protein